jgi:hypothetical protein
VVHYTERQYAEPHYNECHNAEPYYADCHYVECRGAFTALYSIKIPRYRNKDFHKNVQSRG